MSAAVALRALVQSAFQSSQSNSESHRSLGLNLRAAHAEALRSNAGGDFFEVFVRCLDRILVTSRKDQCAARVVEFVAAYTRLICPDDDGDDEVVNSEFETYVEFIEAVIERYIPGFASRLSHVRFRCVSLVGTLVPLAPLNEALLDLLEQRAIDRLRDADARVRTQAVILVSRFELSDATADALATAMQFDPSVEVRLAATYNIAHGSKALTELACERVRDSGPQIRRGLYAKVLKTIDFRALSIHARESIVRAGLNDRDEAVRRAASLLVANRWVSMSDNNIQLVLQRLDVIRQTEVADMVLKAFYEQRRDIVDTLEFGTEFWADLWVEDTLMLRGFQEFCLRERLGELLDDVMPELSTLSAEIEKLWKKYTDAQTYELATEDEVEDLKECLPFMVEQLLQTASRYDLSDEASRQRLTAVINDIVMADDAPSMQTIEHIIDIQRRLNASDSALVSWAFETLEAMPSLATQASDEAILTSLLRALSLFKSVLSRVSSHDVAAYLPSLYTTYVMPALQSPVSEIRAPALECLGLACLLDQKFTLEHFKHFCDYITTNGAQFFESASRRGSAVSSPVDEDTDADADLVHEIEISISAICDMLLAYPDAELPVHAVAHVWLALLRCDSSKVQGAAALSLSKIVLANMLENPHEIVLPLVSFYFENSAGIEDDETRALTQQQLTLFLRAYCLYNEGKEVVATVFAEATQRFIVEQARKTSVLTIGEFATQLLELTGPNADARRAPAPVEPANAADPGTWHHAHALIGLAIVTLIFSTDASTIRRSLAVCLSKLELADAPLAAVERIQATLESRGELEEVKVVPVRNALVKFHDRLAEQITQQQEQEQQAQEQQAQEQQEQEQQEQEQQPGFPSGPILRPDTPEDGRGATDPDAMLDDMPDANETMTIHNAQPSQRDEHMPVEPSVTGTP